MRQVLALTSYPDLVNLVPEGTFPTDAVERAQQLLNANPGGSGAYSDGYPCPASEIFLSNGASQSVQNVMMVFSGHPDDGFLVPIPQYPLYSATTSLYGAKLVGYYLDEENRWGLDLQELEKSIAYAKENHIHLKGLVIINPGNPTGMVAMDGDADA